MNDLISRKAALDNAWQVMYKDEWHMTQTEQVISVNDIEALPTIDAVPVVRCKECKYYRAGEKLSPQKFCFRLIGRDGEAIGYNFAEDDFCSYGERSEDGEN